MQKARGHSRSCSHRLWARGFRYYFTPLPGYFSPFPHGTSPLSVTREYLALEGGPPRFSPRFTGADLLRNAIGRPWDFVYGTIALCGARFHALRLSHGLVTPAGPCTARTGALQPLVRNACTLTRTKFGLIPFRSPLLGESRLIYFPRGTEMFQFPRLPLHAYVFSVQYRRITSGGFPHSEIRGSQSVQRLPAAYRSRPRPSSTPGAKASTMCPY